MHSIEYYDLLIKQDENANISLKNIEDIKLEEVIDIAIEEGNIDFITWLFTQKEELINIEFFEDAFIKANNFNQKKLARWLLDYFQTLLRYNNVFPLDSLS